MDAGLFARILIFLGSAIMLVNIILYIRFERYITSQWGWNEGRAGLYLPIALLVLFLAGYLTVGVLGEPDMVVGGILFGGSLFVLLVLRLLRDLAGRVQQSEQLRIDLMAAERASASKTEFLSNMSHDIRTPLNAVIGYASLAEDESLSKEELREYIHKIGSSGRHLLDLINDVLEMSRIESGRIELDEQPADIVKTARDVYDVFSDQMNGKGLDFDLDVTGITCRSVVMDRVRFSRILMNLVSNAYKFTPEGGSVKVTLTQDGDDYVLSVKDTGIGMSDEFAAKVFDSFERERTSTASGIEGTGLGMTITKRFVELMGGTISVKTAPGAGTEFTVRLPLEQTEESLPDPSGSSTDEECGCENAEGMTVLLAEDVEMNREIASMMLDNMGFCVETAVNGREAFEMVRDSVPGHYDAVLMDIQMPEMNGYEAAALIRGLDDPMLASIPIIAVTANAFEEDRQKTRDAGMDAHVSKPLDPAELRNTLRGLLHPE